MDEQILKDAEMYLLGSIFNDPNAIYKAYSALSPQDFSDSRHGLVFASMQELANENIPIDILSVLEKCSRHGSKLVEKNYLFEINESVPSSAAFEHYITIIKDCSGRRALQKLCGKIAGMVKEDEKTEDIVSEIYEELASLGKKKKEPATAAESIAILNEMIANRKHLGVPTGIVSLDYKITGMRPGEMIVLAAPPSIGKTALALSIANNAIMSGKSVVFFTLEMTTGEIATRLVSMNSRVNSLHILNANLQFGEREKVQAAVELYVKTNIRIDDSSEIKVADMRMTCNAIKCKTGALDLVVVDYLQLIESSKKENQTIAMGDISRSLKIMAKELNVPVLCLSQLNRGYKDGKISLYNLRDSGNIEQDANQVWFITFPIANEPKHAILEIAKNRNGEKGTIDLLYEAEYTLFTDYPASRMVREPKADKDGFFPVEDM
ncbi:DNA helicase [Fibrobacteria bacterium R8-3-H12]